MDLADADGRLQIPLPNQIVQDLLAGSVENTVALVLREIALNPGNTRRYAVKRGARPPDGLIPLKWAELTQARHALLNDELGHVASSQEAMPN